MTGWGISPLTFRGALWAAILASVLVLSPAAVLAAAPALTVGDLGTIEGPIAGTLTDLDGGLGRAMWAGSDRAVVEGILDQAVVASPSSTARFLTRKLLLTAAIPPAGRGQGTFNATRIRKLLLGGYVEDAADLARAVRTTDADTQRVQADAFLAAGHDADACGEGTTERLRSAERFWIALRAYCYAVAADDPALDLTRAVIEAEALGDEALFALLDAEQGTPVTAIPAIAAPTMVHLRLLVRHEMPLTADMVNALGLPANVAALRSEKTPREVRVASAERLLRLGALPPQALADALLLIVFRPQDLVGAAAMARNEPLLPALARLRAASKTARTVEQRAELAHTAFQLGEREGVLPQVAMVFGEDTATLVPARAWGNWAELMARSLLLAGQPGAAGRWFDILPAVNPDRSAAYLRAIYSVVAPNDPRSQLAPQALVELAATSSVRGVSPSLLTRAMLALGLVEATGRDMPPEARARTDALLQIRHPGVRPPQLALQRIDAAALAGKRGEAVLGVLGALGPKGARDLAPDLVVRLVRALRTAGVNDGARALTIEALLTYPTGT